MTLPVLVQLVHHKTKTLRLYKSVQIVCVTELKLGGNACYCLILVGWEKIGNSEVKLLCKPQAEHFVAKPGMGCVIRSQSVRQKD